MSRSLYLALQLAVNTVRFAQESQSDSYVSRDHDHDLQRKPLLVPIMDVNMSDAAATPHSASWREDAEHPKVPETRVCEAFNNPAGNIVFKSSDNVIFRMEDFFLKATR